MSRKEPSQNRPPRKRRAAAPTQETRPAAVQTAPAPPLNEDLTTSGVDAFKKITQWLRKARDYAAAVADALREPLLVLDGELCVHRANQAYYQMFKTGAAETENRRIYELGNRQWDIPELRELLEKAGTHGTPFTGYQVEREFPRAGMRTMLVDARALPGQEGRPVIILLSIEDITERRRLENSLHDVSEQLLRLHDEEKAHIARELHDTTAQGLAALSLNLALLQRSLKSPDAETRKTLEEALHLAEQCSREIRTLSYLLHPPLLDEAGLGSALRWYVDGFTKRTGIAVDLEVEMGPERPPADIEQTLFRVAQECLTNIHRHSGSRTAKISILRHPKTLTLEVQDEGRGLPAELLEEPPRPFPGLGVGILSMRARLRQHRGQLEFSSGGRGAIVRAFIPLQGKGRPKADLTL